MKPALILVDLQNDFVARPGMDPGVVAHVMLNIEYLLILFRRRGLPVLHVHTLVKADGSDRMPHWKSSDRLECVEGTSGAMPWDALAPKEDEPVIRKRSFSGFESGELQRTLKARGIDRVVLAGLFTHGCIRATAMDAYALGYTVRIASDCVASPEPAHALISRQWMDQREMRFVESWQVFENLGLVAKGTATQPVADDWSCYNPARSSEMLGRVACADATSVDFAVRRSVRAQLDWAKTSPGQRAEVLRAWANLLGANRDSLAPLLAQEIGKPVTDAAEEVDRAIAHIDATVRLLMKATASAAGGAIPFAVFHRPVGTVALITPWNNPVAIPAGKIAPALAFGNGVVWKPALYAPRTSEVLAELLTTAGLPEGVLTTVSGDGLTAQSIIAHPDISAVSFTGSNQVGEEVAAVCGVLQKPLQAELGGNNAALVLADADLESAAQAIAASAFSFAGQRCTATRRIIVERAIREPFLKLLMAAVRRLVVGEPLDPATQVGPLISKAHLEEVESLIELAVTESGGRVICGGTRPPEMSHGNWLLPTLIECDSPDAPIVQRETFGPVAVILNAVDFEQALAICNGVDAGLVASLYARDPRSQQRFIEAAQAGILRINPQSFPVHPDAPFLGWKSSGTGPAEHGRWDLEFYSRPQAVYGHHFATDGPGSESTSLP
jgi:acyl-CoA reductase-like NAD-dependent aldehyde dehydrogenase